MTDSTRDLFDALARVLLRCWVCGYVLLFVWAGAFVSHVIHKLHGPLMRLSDHLIDNAEITVAAHAAHMVRSLSHHALRRVVRDPSEVNGLLNGHRKRAVAIKLFHGRGLIVAH